MQRENLVQNPTVRVCECKYSLYISGQPGSTEPNSLLIEIQHNFLDLGIKVCFIMKSLNKTLHFQPPCTRVHDRPTHPLYFLESLRYFRIQILTVEARDQSPNQALSAQRHGLAEAPTVKLKRAAAAGVTVPVAARAEPERRPRASRRPERRAAETRPVAAEWRSAWAPPTERRSAAEWPEHLESWVMLYSTHRCYIAMSPYQIARRGKLYSCQGCNVAGCYNAP